MRTAWETIKQEALAKDVELFLSRWGRVQARSYSVTLSPPSRRRYPGDDQCYTLAETIEFVYAHKGTLAYAMHMWSKMSNDIYPAMARAMAAYANEFHSPNPAVRHAWNTIKAIAENNGVELTRSNSGIVQAKSRDGQNAARKKHPADGQWYTLAETIEFVFVQDGSFAFAMNMWNNQMEDH